MKEEIKKYLSREKHNELLKELHELKTSKRKEIADQLEFAKSLGDLSENAEYQEAKEDQATTEQRIRDIEELLKHAEIVSTKQRSQVGVGSKVTVKKGQGTSHEMWEIVGSEEANLAQRKISNESPLGTALFGKKVGDHTEILTPGGKVEYHIVKID